MTAPGVRFALALIAAATALAAPVPDVAAQTDAEFPLVRVSTIETDSFDNDPPPLVLSNGNYVISSPRWKSGGSVKVGSVSLFDGRTNERLSTLRGNFTNDSIGTSLYEVGDSNVLIASPRANFFGIADLGAVTWMDGDVGLSGTISPSNSLFGTDKFNGVGRTVAILTSGHAVVGVPNWSGPDSVLPLGAATWIDGDRGATGFIEAENSLTGVGETLFGGRITPLLNGDYLVHGEGQLAPNGPEGFVTYAIGDGSTTGHPTTTNSLYGLRGNVRIAPITDDEFIVTSSGWRLNPDERAVGAIAWINGATETVGPLTVDRVLHGTTASGAVGGVVVIDEEHALVGTPSWDLGDVKDVGAVTVLRGSDPVTGPVSPLNSLIGSSQDDQVGKSLTEFDLTQTSARTLVLASRRWDSPSALDAGAATWIDLDDPPVGSISIDNSLIGSTRFDFSTAGVCDPDFGGEVSDEICDPVFQTAPLVTALADGAAALALSAWDHGEVQEAGIVVRIDAGVVGEITPSMGLHGTRAKDRVGTAIAALPDGRYIVGSRFWSSPEGDAVGAVNWIDPDDPPIGPVTTTNSLHGTSSNDQVGAALVTTVDGQTAVLSPEWALGTASSVGAVTWADSNDTLTGPVTTANSLHGVAANDLVGGGGAVELSDGTVIVQSPAASSGTSLATGAVTRLSDSPPVGPIGPANSLVGQRTGSNLGARVVDLGSGNALFGPSRDGSDWALQPSQVEYRGIVSPDRSFELQRGSFGGFSSLLTRFEIQPTAGDGALFLTRDDDNSAKDLVAVNLDLPPEFVDPPSRVEIVRPPGAGSDNVWFSLPAVTDMSSSASVACSPEPGTPFPVGPTTVRCTATDENAGQSSTSFIVEVQAPDDLSDVITGSPLRLVDTRSTGSTVDGDFAGDGRLLAGSVLEVDIGGRANVPADSASAVIVNVTAIRPDSRGFITVFPCAARPLASSLNMSSAGGVFGNEVIASLDDDGRICVYTSTATDLAIDVAGWIPTSSSYEPVVPARLLDTRLDGTTIDTLNSGEGRDAATTTRLEVQVTSRADIPTDATSAVLNLTGINPDQRGFVTAYPCGERPLASSLNFDASRIVRGNELVAPLSEAGTVCLYSSTPTDLTVDVAGYFADGDFSGMTPSRVFETRVTERTVDGLGEHNRRIHRGETIQIPLAERAGIPAGSRSVVVNATAVNSVSPGFIAVFPCEGRPPTASVNVATLGATVGNEIAVDLSSAGEICIYSTAPTDLTVDVVGSFGS